MNLRNAIAQELAYIPTEDQRAVLHALERFTLSKKANPILLINGHAGTGKTSLISAYVRTLKKNNMYCRLMAPTGRAAKVFSSFADKPASTIHRSIYWRSRDEHGAPAWVRQENKSYYTVFIVDEASMISSSMSMRGSGFTHRTLLEDLVEYVFEKKGNRLILLGDLAQLPPIGELESKALNPEYFKGFGNFPLAMLELKEVVRQEEDSAVLANATKVRHLIDQKSHEFPHFQIGNTRDFFAIDGSQLAEALEENYDDVGIDQMIFVTWSNKRANLFNQQIRQRILWFEEEINAGDHLMVVKNNYFWLENEFIANGDVIYVDRVNGFEDIHNLRFADLTVHLMDDDQRSFDVKVIVNVLSEEGPALSPEKAQQLFDNVEEDYMDLRSKAKRMKKIMTDPYFNALQVKFAYAVTAHKSQGGQWPVVFLDQPYIREALPAIEDLKWMYTGMTRSSDRLYLVNFSQEFFEID